MLSTGHTFTICTPRRGRGEGESLLRHGQFIGSAFVDAVDTIQELLYIDVEFNLDPIVPEHRNLFDDVAADHFLDLHRAFIKNLGPGHDPVELGLHLLDLRVSIIQFRGKGRDSITGGQYLLSGILQHFSQHILR